MDFFLPKPWAFHIYVGMGWYGQLFAQQSTHSLDNRQYSTVWGVDNLYNNLKQFWVVHIIRYFYISMTMTHASVIIHYSLFTSLRDGNRPHRIVGQPLVTANDVSH